MSVALWDGVVENGLLARAAENIEVDVEGCGIDGRASGWRTAGRSTRLRRNVAMVPACVGEGYRWLLAG